MHAERLLFLSPFIGISHDVPGKHGQKYVELQCFRLQKAAAQFISEPVSEPVLHVKLYRTELKSSYRCLWRAGFSHCNRLISAQ